MLFILVGVSMIRRTIVTLRVLGTSGTNAGLQRNCCFGVFCRVRFAWSSGFVSEAMCFIGAFPVFRTIVIISTIGILLNAAYFFGPSNGCFLGN
ncbi:MAG: hypothetical protein CM1200mP10_15350 [Candidatus Neomarinimicrobiota bacterium]|nr:MAG: hypothetical protein CM1200mP10_15350 [Candidatus Neomarinimicrobiota bacterium]